LIYRNKKFAWILIQTQEDCIRSAWNAQNSFWRQCHRVNTDFWMVLLIQTCGNISWRLFAFRWFLHRSQTKHWEFRESSRKTGKVSFWLAGQASCMEHAHQILREDLNNWCNCARFVLSSPSMSRSSRMCLCDGNVRGHSLGFLLWPRNQTAVLFVKKPVPAVRTPPTPTHTHTCTFLRSQNLSEDSWIWNRS
jgi:hypothetical protein